VGSRLYATIGAVHALRPRVTREERVTILLVILGFVLGGPVGYRRTAWWPMLWVVGDVLIIVMLILFAAGVQLRAKPRPWRPRMLLVLVAVVTLPLSVGVGAMINDLDFEFRRKTNYEALIAAVKPSLVVHDDEAFQVPVPASVKGSDVSLWARRQTDGQVVLEFPWSRRVYYVYCTGQGCERDKLSLSRR
jgi:hypothetical protein